eukprot:TRINITY_DN888_c0_g1_i4.p1 TRINITY_DN888_c0_g1~~TRINITY_DN888_c0_g1_i4.p1  ORF type:complete len:818 (-),score=277.81 TRINITY_DN888_c0_g1_i4:3485-5938(-)
MYMGRGEQLHFARLAIWEFMAKHGGQQPKLHDVADADECVAIAKEILKKYTAIEGAVTVEAIDEAVIKSVAMYHRAELPGFTTFIGGVLAQEVVKKFGKFTPLYQWLQFDMFELLSKEVPADSKPIGSRYDHQIAIFGKKFQDLLGKQRWFMVGCGALGCEYLKAFALMGLGASPEGTIYVTDMDRIEVSNLSRQFLFRKDNVGQQKSVCAANAARVFNSEMNIKCFETKVAPETESTFDDNFWNKLHGVCNALDNVIARRYVDSRCVFFEKPLMESGTEGTKANSEIVLPHQTMSYGEGKDTTQGGGIPMCTLRNFPHLIDHCIEWARAQFTDLFDVPAKDGAALLSGDSADAALAEFAKGLAKEGNHFSKMAKITSSIEALHGCEKPTMEMCIEKALKQFYKDHTQRIVDLTKSFPEDAVAKDADTGESHPFWSGTKRFPQIAHFETKNDSHKQYIYAVANLFAYIYNVPQERSIEKFSTVLENVAGGKKYETLVEKWKAELPAAKVVLTEGAAAEATEKRERPDSSVPSAKKQRKEEKSSSEDSDSDSAEEDPDKEKKEFAAAEEKLRNLVVSLRKAGAKAPNPADFEKDDDTNFHIDFITRCSNMRAWNYHINEASRHQCKMIAGKIIPAIATTTALITGLVSLEMYKVIMGFPKAKICSSNINLAFDLFELFEPPNPNKAEKTYDPVEMADVVPVPEGFTVWDKVVINKGDMTVAEFIKMFPEWHHGVEVKMLMKSGASSGDSQSLFLYSDFAPTKTMKEAVEKYKKMKMSAAYEDLYQVSLKGKSYILLEGSFEREDCPVKIPPIKFMLPM